VYGKGSYVEALDRLALLFEYQSRREEQRRVREQGRLLGIGLACSLELGGIGSAMPVAPGTGVRPGVEGVSVRIDQNGAVLIVSGVPSMGQQPESMLVRIIEKELGAAPAHVSLIHDDMGAASFSGGVFAGRGAVIAGGAAAQAAALLREKILRLAAHVMAVNVYELTIENSVVTAHGRDGVSFKQLGEIAYLNAHLLPEGMEPGLAVTQFFDPKHGVFANSAHAALVEVDPELLTIKVLDYAVVTDCGERMNHDAVVGQILGGVVYGSSLALCERILYDQNGYLIYPRKTSYPLARATEIPDVKLDFLCTPAASRTGAKPVGQSATITTPAALANAVADALAPMGIAVNQLPITPDYLLRK
jgi:carbon-monoxide dehydrogenase large subunit